ncbi:MAG: glycosyltransferase, partial [Nitrospiria bacterium]
MIEVLALIIFIFFLIGGTEAFFGVRTLKFLKEISSLEGEKFPLISIVIAARNEFKKIEPALLSVLKQDYPNFEVIVIDDRSTDGTSALLDRIVKEYGHLQVLHVSQLPEGWLGKNYSLYFGAQMASGEFLLFMDADVIA